MTPSRLAQVFSCIGHAFMHMFTAMYFVIAVAMEKEGWNGMRNADLMELWTLGALMVGLAAVPSGMLGDRWSLSGMMVVYFLGLGASAIVCALVDGPSALFIGLSVLGVLAAIYHPVGIAWLVRSSGKRGKALGINGVFGSIGVSVAGLVAGGLTELFSWRAAFLVPGVVCFVVGLALLYCRQRGLVNDAAAPQKQPDSVPKRSEAIRVYFILLCTMTCMGLIFQATQAAIPKHFDLRLGDVIGHDAFLLGVAVAFVYTAGGIMQILGGVFADRMNLKRLYVATFFFQIPVMMGLAFVGGVGLLPIAAATVLLSTGALPAENMMLARYTPAQHRGLAYGLKFVLAFGTAPLAIQAAVWVERTTGEFQWLFAGLTALAAIAAFAAALLPGGKDRASSSQVNAVPAE